MRVGGQEFTPEIRDRIAGAVEAEPALSRTALSRLVCEWLEWRDPKGRLREAACRKALLELDRRGVLRLPESARRPGSQAGAGKAGTATPPPEHAAVRCPLEQLGEIEVVAVERGASPEAGVWNALLEAYHPLGRGPLCGAQIRYLIRSSEHGWLGGMSFSSSAWRLKDRDAWIGWSEAARRRNLQQVVCNSRLLILPTVEVPNLASHVLSLATKRLPQDWLERYGYEPLLIETFVDPLHQRGTCYRAANWERVGESAGRTDGFMNGKVSTGKKDLYCYPLREGWRAALCEEPEDRLQVPPKGVAKDWAEEEFGRAELFDPRLSRRLLTIVRDFFAQPGALVPEACNGSEAKTKAAYRFFDNKEVQMDRLLKSHVESTIQRIQPHKVVLAVQDTSSLNYTAHPSTEGLGPIGTSKQSAVGLILHDTMAFSTEGTPLGLLDAQCWARDPEDAGKRARRKELPIEEKESMKWLTSYRAVAEVQELCPQTRLVSVADREADLYELFHEATRSAKSPDLLIRAERSRGRKVEQETLWKRMDQSDVRGHREIVIPRSGSRKQRTAKLEVRHEKVCLSAPRGKNLEKVELWAVHAREVGHGPQVRSPLEWMLLTTVEVASFEDAIERLDWYSKRWGIEVYHRTLKSGCRIEDRQLATTDRLESCLAIDMVVAWRVFLLARQGRETPNIPCDEYLQEAEWKVLCLKLGEGIDEPPPLGQAVRMIAQLGGFLGRKRDGNPGVTTLWRGLGHLEGLAAGYRLALETYGQRAGP